MCSWWKRSGASLFVMLEFGVQRVELHTLYYELLVCVCVLGQLWGDYQCWGKGGVGEQADFINWLWVGFSWHQLLDAHTQWHTNLHTACQAEQQEHKDFADEEQTSLSHQCALAVFYALPSLCRSVGSFNLKNWEAKDTSEQFRLVSSLLCCVLQRRSKISPLRIKVFMF